MENPALLIFIKNPELGKAKTRLAATVGDERALKMYRQLLAYTREQTAVLPDVSRHLYYSSFVDQEDEWSGQTFLKFVQRGATLGDRMLGAFEHAFARGHQGAVIIGSDCPGVTTELLQRAFTALKTADVVLGPATDGGYYLLGLRRPQPTLFTDMEWSTETVAEETRARARVRGLRLVELEALSDVDYLADWEGYGWEVPA